MATPQMFQFTRRYLHFSKLTFSNSSPSPSCRRPVTARRTRRTASASARRRGSCYSRARSSSRCVCSRAPSCSGDECALGPIRASPYIQRRSLAFRGWNVTCILPSSPSDSLHCTSTNTRAYLYCTISVATLNN